MHFVGNIQQPFSRHVSPASLQVVPAGHFPTTLVEESEIVRNQVEKHNRSQRCRSRLVRPTHKDNDKR
jgi:hypothetical protein